MNCRNKITSLALTAVGSIYGHLLLGYNSRYRIWPKQ